MTTRRRLTLGLSALALLAGVAMPGPLTNAAQAQDGGEINLYSSRHYDTDERLYSDFEAETGIKVNRIEDGADVLIERMVAEGRNSPADVLLTTDAGRLWRADEAGLLQPIDSTVLDERIPKNVTGPEGEWYGFSKRARVIFYDKADVAEPPRTYQELADPEYEGQVCTRSGSNIYMLSLLASIIENDGEAEAEDWARGVKANLARDPQGGDTDQLRAIVSGECEIAIANTYYYARAVDGDVEGLSGSTDMIGVVFPNQETTGTHVNISGGGVATNAPNPENAVRFLEYLAGDSAQRYFADGNNEYPVVEGIDPPAAVAALGAFKADPLDVSALGRNQALAQQIYDRVGYE